MPNPARAFSHENPIHIYFEIYTLTQDSIGNTEFTIEYTLSSLKGKEKGIKTLFGLFGGGGKSSVTIRTDRKGDDEFSVEYLAIDVSKVEPGDYELSVKVRDKHTGETVKRTKRITLL